MSSAEYSGSPTSPGGGSQARSSRSAGNRWILQEGSSLEVGTTKNRDGRTFPLDVLPARESILRAQRAYTHVIEAAQGKTPVPWVFHFFGRPILNFRDAWERACARADLRGRSPDFRRLAVRNLERAGVSRSVAMKLTGHKTEPVYRRYAIVSETDLREGVAKLARMMVAVIGGAA